MNKHYHIVYDILPKIQKEVLDKLNNIDVRRYISYGNYIGKVIKDPTRFFSGKAENVFHIWYDSITFSYNCAFTDDYYDDIMPIIHKYSDIIDDVFVHNPGDIGNL